METSIKISVFGKRCIVLMLALCFVTCIFVAFKAPATPPNSCEKIAKINFVTSVYKVSDNGDIYIVVVNDQNGNVSLIQRK